MIGRSFSCHEGHPRRHPYHGAELPDRRRCPPPRNPLAVTCGGGYRSSVAANLLAHHGHDVLNVTGDITRLDHSQSPH